jgi:hypothetical protein
MSEWLLVTDPIKDITRCYIDAALSTPFLMNQLLAIAALHLSTIHPTRDVHYRHLGLELRSRAVDGFKANRDNSSKQSRVSQFLFSSLMAVFAMVEKITFAPAGSDQLIDRCVEYFQITRGVQIVGDSYWNVLHDSELSWIFTSFGSHHDYNNAPNPFADLEEMLNNSELEGNIENSCLNAIRSLGLIQKQLESPNSWGVHAVMAWAKLIEPKFTQLLERRVPEALVVLGHYSDMLHRFRHFWGFGRSGERLLIEIGRSVAPRWSRYLPMSIQSLPTG